MKQYFDIGNKDDDFESYKRNIHRLIGNKIHLKPIDNKMRMDVIYMLKYHFRYLVDLNIKCDEENNPPEIVNDNSLVARVMFRDISGIKYFDYKW